MGSGFLKRKRDMAQLQRAQMEMLERMEGLEVTGSAGNGRVQVILKGNGKVRDIKVDPSCVNPQDIEGLQDLLCAAINDASQKLEEASKHLAPAGFPGF